MLSGARLEPGHSQMPWRCGRMSIVVVKLLYYIVDEPRVTLPDPSLPFGIDHSPDPAPAPAHPRSVPTRAPGPLEGSRRAPKTTSPSRARSPLPPRPREP